MCKHFRHGVSPPLFLVSSPVAAHLFLPLPLKVFKFYFLQKKTQILFSPFLILTHGFGLEVHFLETGLTTET